MSSQATDELTPLMKQYWDLKHQAGDALLFFRMGDFYELFSDDAVEASRILEITLTTRDKNKTNPMPMAGVPHHSAQGYIQRLLKAGKKVAIGEQVEDPSAASARGAKSIVRREIVRTFTPAVQFDHEGSEAAYLTVALPGEAPARGAPRPWILACLDPSTGEAIVSDPLIAGELARELSQLPIRHVLRVGHELPEEALITVRSATSQGAVLLEDLPANFLSPVQAVETLKRHYGIGHPETFVGTPAGIHALGILVAYAARTQQQERLAHLRLPAPLRKPSTLQLGAGASHHLDLLPGTDGNPALYSLINRTRSALGARQLKRWLLEPLKITAEIGRRQETVHELCDQRDLSAKLGEELAGLYDLERIAGRVNARLANPRDTLTLGHSLALLPVLAQRLGPTKGGLLRELRKNLLDAATNLLPLAERIVRTQREDAPLTSRDAGIFGRGTTPELDRLISLTEDGQRWLIELEAREREATGIPSLKVRYNRVFGYYIEITQAHVKNAPAHYQRKQTTVGAERFFTEELKKFEDEIVHASTRQKALEQQLFEELVQAVQEKTSSIMDAARALGELDALIALGRLGQEPGWVFPTIDDSMDFEIEAGRHPLVDSTSGGTFVPNDLRLSPQTRLTLLITGPNMGGKSTVMRQAALIVILGQMGAPVPAAAARWGAVSSIHTRIGAHDAIARGQSTFMVEMSELAHILHSADSRSLIVLDEIGRGTSTYDGISVAWATLEWICSRIQARTLFATHYHELTKLAASLPLVANAHMAVEGTRPVAAAGQRKAEPQRLRFLYLLSEGPANESFGIHVARLAGLPQAVIDRAWSVLDELERNQLSSASAHAASTAQLSLFDTMSEEEETSPEPEPFVAPTASSEPAPETALAREVLQGLEDTDINAMTPVQALNFLARLQETVRGSRSVSA